MLRFRIYLFFNLTQCSSYQSSSIRLESAALSRQSLQSADEPCSDWLISSLEKRHEASLFVVFLDSIVAFLRNLSGIFIFHYDYSWAFRKTCDHRHSRARVHNCKKASLFPKFSGFFSKRVVIGELRICYTKLDAHHGIYL